MSAIQITGLSKTFTASFLSRQNPCFALDDVTLEIKKGSIYTILGPNGAGKSTLLRILAGLLPCSKGSFQINGRIGLFMSGMYGFWGFLSGQENLEYFAALQNIVRSPAQKKIDELIDMFGMKNYIWRPIRTYSSGMKHRLLLARTLLHDPDILLLDEPVNYLDPLAARELHLLLRNQLNRKLGKTILLSTHQLEEAQEISDTLGFLFQGKLLWEKSAEPFRSHQADLLGEYFRSVKETLK